VQSVIKAQTNILMRKLELSKHNIEKQKRETIYDIVSMMSKYLGTILDADYSWFIGY
jgi:hypothetical protein